MEHGIHLNDESRVGVGEYGAGDFARRVRRLALDAHQILNHPDSSLDELIALHSRVFYLLQEVRGAQSSAIGRWLLAVRREIGVKLQCWSLEDLESSVA
jgi:hypothetical protein